MSSAVLSAGAELPSREFGPVTRTDIVRYQGASGDFNPIHHDEPFARDAGFVTVLSVGMLQAGYLATYCVDLFGAENVRALRVRFRGAVWPGDVLTCRGVVSTLVEGDDGERILTLELAAERGHEPVLTGTAVFSVPGGNRPFPV